jgi:phosphomannomutase / phosphoglucomutase
LRERVLSTGAKLGLAWDGDGDRLGAIDEHGEIVWGDKLMILFSRALLAEHPGATILGEVKCSETLFDDVRARGGRVLYARTGHSLIKSMMKAEGALLAGEMSGHLFFADRWLGFDDGIYAALRLLEIVAQHQKGIGELLGDVPRTYATPEIRVDVSDEQKFDVVARVRARFEATHPVLAIDGARVDFGDGAWGLCRASNTQPVLVLRFEAKSEARLAEIRAEVEAAVQAAGGLGSSRARLIERRGLDDPPRARVGGRRPARARQRHAQARRRAHARARARLESHPAHPRLRAPAPAERARRLPRAAQTQARRRARRLPAR